MDVFLLPNGTFTNPSQLIKTSSTDERAQNYFWFFKSARFSQGFVLINLSKKGNVNILLSAK